MQGLDAERSQSVGSVAYNGLKRKPSRLVRAITNPNEVLAGLMPQPKQPDPNAKRLEDFKLARALGGMGLNYGIGEPDQPKRLPPADSPLFHVDIDPSIADKLPSGYQMRSLQRSDYGRGYTRLKIIGNIDETAWNERCEYLRSRADMYTILVIADGNDRIVATGTLLLERKLSSGLSLVGHIEDLAVGEGQSGMNLGLRMLGQLDRLALQFGCGKTILNTQEANEAFHRQKGFRRTGIEMTHNHRLAIKRMKSNSRICNRPASPERIAQERALASAALNEPRRLIEQI